MGRRRDDRNDKDPAFPASRNTARPPPRPAPLPDLPSAAIVLVPRCNVGARAQTDQQHDPPDQTYWTDPAQDAQNLAWIRGFYTDMYGARGPYPDDTFDGCYVNHCDSDLADWQFLYYKGNYSRLQTAKYQWEQSIEPLSAPAQDG